jgi:hypothetical protein
MLCFSSSPIGSLEEKKYQRRDLEAFVHQKQAETLQAARSGPPSARRARTSATDTSERDVDADPEPGAADLPASELEAGELPAIFLTLTSAPGKWEHLDRLIRQYYGEGDPGDASPADARNRRHHQAIANPMLAQYYSALKLELAFRALVHVPEAP